MEWSGSERTDPTMAQRITPETTEAIIKAVAEDGASYRGLARQFGISRKTVAKIIHSSPPEEPEKHQDVAFRRCKRYWCVPCRQWLIVKPCPVCVLASAELAGTLRNADLLRIAERFPAPQEWYDE